MSVLNKEIYIRRIPCFCISSTNGSSALNNSLLNGFGSIRSSIVDARRISISLSSNRSSEKSDETIAISISLHLPAVPFAKEPYRYASSILNFFEFLPESCELFCLIYLCFQPFIYFLYDTNLFEGEFFCTFFAKRSFKVRVSRFNIELVCGHLSVFIN